MIVIHVQTHKIVKAREITKLDVWFVGIGKTQEFLHHNKIMVKINVKVIIMQFMTFAIFFVRSNAKKDL
jgi:hypothetical protein